MGFERGILRNTKEQLMSSITGFQAKSVPLCQPNGCELVLLSTRIGYLHFWIVTVCHGITHTLSILSNHLPAIAGLQMGFSLLAQFKTFLSSFLLLKRVRGRDRIF